MSSNPYQPTAVRASRVRRGVRRYLALALLTLSAGIVVASPAAVLLYHWWAIDRPDEIIVSVEFNDRPVSFASAVLGPLGLAAPLLLTSLAFVGLAFRNRRRNGRGVSEEQEAQPRGMDDPRTPARRLERTEKVLDRLGLLLTLILGLGMVGFLLFLYFGLR